MVGRMYEVVIVSGLGLMALIQQGKEGLTLRYFLASIKVVIVLVTIAVARKHTWQRRRLCRSEVLVEDHWMERVQPKFRRTSIAARSPRSPKP